MDGTGRRNPGGRAAVRSVAAALAVPLLLVAGLWLTAGVLAPSYTTSLIAGVAWCVLAIMGLNRLARPTAVRRAVRVSTAVCAVALAGAFWWTSVRDVRVDEDVAVGVAASELAEPAGPVAEAPPSGAGTRPAAMTATPAPERDVQVLDGPVQALSHSASGRAAVVELARGGRVLTLTGFEIDPGPDVRVYLAAGNPRTDADVDDFRSLGALKGNVGDQQYRIPRGLDLDRYDTVVFWCVPFSNAIARAPLRPS